ncbi:MAG: YiiD C-terminal domain-containing protein [Bdellovibrio sp.]|jgi:thioesterase domain-containing protein
MTPQELESYIRSQIPALQGFECRITALGPYNIRVDARLQDHLNHKGTGFGGSLYQVAIVASYGLFLHLVREAQIPTQDFVISRGELHYRAPVESDFTAELEVSKDEAQKFLNKLKTRGKADLWMNTEIKTGNKLCAELHARFVAFYTPAAN